MAVSLISKSVNNFMAVSLISKSVNKVQLEDVRPRIIKAYCFHAVYFLSLRAAVACQRTYSLQQNP